MADLLNETDREFFRTTLNDLFDTFKRKITVHKEPLKKIINPALDVYAGYMESSTPQNIEYVLQSKEIEAIVSYIDSVSSQTSALEDDLNVLIPKNASVRIKVKEESRDYIANGVTERIEIDGKSFNLVGKEAVKYNFGTKLYVYYLEQTT